MTRLTKNLFSTAGLVALLSFSFSALAQNQQIKEKEQSEQEQKNKDWDVLNPPFDLATVSIDTDNTTWSSLDITPDGKSMVFDMLGDIYIADIKGGNATALTQDFAWNIHPAVSPNGKK
jgi:Tol biopolymer transport system component